MAFIGTPLDTRNTFQSLVGKRFSGDGSTTGFTLDVAPGSVLDIEVFVGNVRQDPNSAYTLSGTTLTFTGAPPSGTNNIYVVHQAKSVGTIDVPAGGVAAGSLATSVLTGQTDIGGAIADADLFLVDDGAGGTLRKTAASRIKTYVGGFDVTSITGATALAEQPAGTDEIVLSDAGTLKRLDIKHIQNTPSFLAFMNGNQSISNTTYTKLEMDTEVYDSDGTYDHSTNYRFTPGVAGKYFCYAKIRWDTGTDIAAAILAFYKNGSILHKETTFQTNATTHQIGAIIDLDDNDYVEAFAYQNGGSSENVNGDSTLGQDTGMFQAFRIAGV
jgi:hypothetical protein